MVADLVLVHVQLGLADMFYSPDPMFVSHVKPVLHIPQVVTDSKHGRITIEINSIFLFLCCFLCPQVRSIIDGNFLEIDHSDIDGRFILGGRETISQEFNVTELLYDLD